MPGPAERPATVEVPVTFEPATGDRFRPLHSCQRALGIGRGQDRLDAADKPIPAVRLLDRKPHVESCQQPALLDLAACGQCAARIVQRPGRRAEHDDGVIPVGRPNPSKPMSGPVELARVRDRHEPEVPLREPLPDEQRSVVFRHRRRVTENDPETLVQFLLVRRQALKLAAPAACP